MIDLGKWPTMRVVGERVTPEQAGDILICTMPWFTAFPRGKGWESEARRIGAEFGMPEQPARDDANHERWFRETWRVWMPAFERWCERYGVLSIASEDGPANNLITTTYRSWVNWDGLVAGEFNIGKYPDQLEVLDFFHQVARRFPYLTMTVDLISEHSDLRGGASNEEGYSHCVRIEVAGGAALLSDGLVESNVLPDVEPLVLPDEFYVWQNGVDQFDERGVSPERLREAFAHLTR